MSCADITTNSLKEDCVAASAVESSSLDAVSPRFEARERIEAQEYSFPRRFDPLRPFTGLSFDAMVLSAKNSTCTGYCTVRASVSPLGGNPQEEFILRVRNEALRRHYSEVPFDPFDPEHFADLPIRVVEDGREMEAPDRVIPRTEAEFFSVWFKCLCLGKLNFHFEGAKDFRIECLAAIARLLRLPTGRSILLAASRSAYPVIFRPAGRSHVENSERKIGLISLSTAPIFYPCENTRGVRMLWKLPFHVHFGHEVLHFLQKASLISRATLDAIDTIVPRIFSQKVTGNKHFRSLIERVTILGVNNLVPCENALHYETGSPAAISHITNGFRPIHMFGRDALSDRRSHGRTQIESAAHLGLTGEVLTLMWKYRCSPLEALFGAIDGEELQIAKYALNSGANLLAPHPHKSRTPLELARYLASISRVSQRFVVELEMIHLQRSPPPRALLCRRELVVRRFAVACGGDRLTAVTSPRMPTRRSHRTSRESPPPRDIGNALHSWVMRLIQAL